MINLQYKKFTRNILSTNFLYLKASSDVKKPSFFVETEGGGQSCGSRSRPLNCLSGLYTVFAIHYAICSLPQTSSKWCSVEGAGSGLWRRANCIACSEYRIPYASMWSQPHHDVYLDVPSWCYDMNLIIQKFSFKFLSWILYNPQIFWRNTTPIYMGIHKVLAKMIPISMSLLQGVRPGK